MDPIYLFIALILMALLWKWGQNQKYPVTYVKSASNGKEYLVRNLPDKQAAADMLGSMNQRFDQIITYVGDGIDKTPTKLFKLYVLRDTNIPDSDILQPSATSTTSKSNRDNKLNAKYSKFVLACKRLVANYNTDAISENTPDSAYTSYSENKGQRIVFCIRAKKTNKMVDLNTMMFVGIHELAHLMTRSIGHTDEFWENMRILLRISIRLGVYDCKNYNVESQDYCGTKITDTPLKCGDV